MKRTTIRREKSLSNYLVLWYGDHVNMIMDIHNPDIFQNQMYLDLFANLGVDVTELSADTDFIIISNDGEEVTVLNHFKEDGCTQDTKLGTISLKFKNIASDNDEKPGHYVLCIDGTEYLDGYLSDDFGMKCLVQDAFTGQILNLVDFIYEVDGSSGEVNVSGTNYYPLG